MYIRQNDQTEPKRGWEAERYKSVVGMHVIARIVEL